MGSAYGPKYDAGQDPYIAHAASGIAKMFAPPSMQDVFMGQKAQEMQRKKDAIAALPEAIRPWVQADVADPAKNMGITEALTRASQAGANPRDIDAIMYATYGNANNTFSGLDKVEQTKLGVANANNTAAMDRARLEQQGLMDREILQEKGRSQGSDRVIGRTLESLPSDQLANLARIKTGGIQEYIGPDNKPVLGTALDALGQRAVPDKGFAPIVQNYVYTDRNTGKQVSGSGVYDPVVGWKDAQTGAPLPSGGDLRTFTGQATGTAADMTKPTEWGAKSDLAANELEKPIARLEGLLAQGKLPLSVGDYTLNQITTPTTAPLTVPNMSPEAQVAFNDLHNVMRTYLYLKSGANATDKEVEGQSLMVTPVPGEAPETTRLKMEMLRDRLNFVRSMSGPKPAAQPSAPAAPAAGAPQFKVLGVK